MKLIYVAGPYRAASEWQVTINIREAEEAALALWRMGYAVICPHKNTAFFGGACPDEVWLAGDLEMLARCDAIYPLPRWGDSAGARAEVAEAARLGKSILWTMEAAREYLDPAGLVNET